MKALVTGACGFAGSHLVALLAKHQGTPVDGTHRPEHEPVPPFVREHLLPHTLDINDADACRRVLAQVRPTHLFHLAGPAHVGDSFAQATLTTQAIFGGSVNVLEAAARLSPAPRVLLVSSAEVYGASAKETDPLVETTAVLPDSPYAVAKLAAEEYARFLVRGGRLLVIVSRSFNHIGPGQSEHFATASFAKQIALAEAGLGPAEIKVGNLTAERDFLDVRDVVEGYLALAEQGIAGEVYNLASGDSVRIEKMLTRLVGRSRIPLRIVNDPARQRPVDIPRRRGSADKIRALGWVARIDLDQTLDDLLDSWRQAVAMPGSR